MRSHNKRRRFFDARIDTLECRRLLSAVTTQMEWNGRTIEAIAGEWVVGVRGAATRTVETDEGSIEVPAISYAKEPADLLKGAFGSLAAAGISFGEYLGSSNVFTVRAPTSMAAAAVSKALLAIPGLKYAVPNALAGKLSATTPNDPDFSDQWGLHNTGQAHALYPSGTQVGVNDADIDAPEAWDISKGASGTVVAVLDTGIDYDHPDLVANRWNNLADPVDGVDNDGNGVVDDVWGYDFINNDKNPDDDNGHGTHVAGIIGAKADNGIGVSGVAWGVKLLPVKVFDSFGGLPSIATVTNGMTYVKNLRYAGANIRVANMSFGDIYAWQPWADGIDELATAGVLVVAAAGNDGVNADTSPSYPAAFTSPNLISVAATDDQEQLASFSNYGANSVDLAAPGDEIYSTWFNKVTGQSTYRSLSGTSMAAPMVAGAAVLALGLKPDLTYQELKQSILSSVDVRSQLSGKAATSGRLNVNKLLTYVNTNYAGFSKVVIGDINGVRANDKYLVRPKPGDSSKTEVCTVVGSTITPVATVDNVFSKKIAIFTQSGPASGLAEVVTVADGVINRLYIKGSNGADSLQGGLSGDTIDGSGGDDTIYGSGGGDLLSGAGSKDKIYGDSLHGVGDNDTILGGSGNDSLYGGEGDDDITGGSDADYVEGGIGADFLRFWLDGAVDSGNGGSGTDVLQLDTGAIVDLITQ